MASFKKTLAEKIFRISRTSNQSLTNCRISTSSCSVKTRIPRNPSKTNAVTSDNGIFRRLLHRKANSTTESSEIRSMLVRDNMMEMLRVIDVPKDRVRLDGLVPPEKVGKKATEEEGLTVEDARKLLKVAQLEVVKSRLREMEKTWISYSEFVRVCGEACSDPEQGVPLARMLDESGSVIVIGSMVLLKPDRDQVVKAIGGLIPLPATNRNDPRMKELKEMEKSKVEIDRKADALVRRELWAGLGFFVVQTAGLMRLTFWELTWDVMEPICFYLSTIYCMAGYTFFLRTAKEPTFEGIYKSRLNAKQKGLMKLHNFDLERYNELRKIYYPYSSFSSSEAATSSSVVPALDQAN